MIRKSDGTLVHSIPSTDWVLNIPDSHKFVNIIGAYSADGVTQYTIDSHTLNNGELTVRFGIDNYSGVLKYSYETDEAEPDSTVITGDGGTVNVTVHQYNQKEPSSQQ